MKVIFFIFTILFSVSVLADCCNYEPELSSDLGVTIQHDQNDDCGDETQHTDSEHCHCSPVSHFKIIAENKVLHVSLNSFQAELIPDTETLLVSHFESLIFQPPIS